MTRREGFTLIEVLVALVLATGVLMTARAVLAGVVDGAERITAAASSADSARLGSQRLRTILAFARTLPPDSVSFLGSSRGLFVRSFCPVPGGWSEPCSIALAVDDSAGQFAVVVNMGRAVTIGVPMTGHMNFRYLATAADGGMWLEEWPDSRSLPLAIGLVSGRDTTIFSVGR